MVGPSAEAQQYYTVPDELEREEALNRDRDPGGREKPLGSRCESKYNTYPKGEKENQED